MADDKLEQLKQLAALDPEDPVVFFGLGSEYLRRGEDTKAVEAFRRTLELKPDYSAAYRELGKALEKLGQRDAALQAYRQCLEVAQKKGDLQTAREVTVFLKRLGGG